MACVCVCGRQGQPMHHQKLVVTFFIAPVTGRDHLSFKRCVPLPQKMFSDFTLHLIEWTVFTFLFQFQ